MNERLIDLADSSFWGVLLVAVIVLTPLVNGMARRIAFCAINIAFLAAILSQRQLGAMLVLLLGVYVSLLCLQLRAWRTTAAVIISLGLLGLFLIHKLPEQAAAWRIPGGPILAMIGFSYVSLRAVELTRAVYEQRHPAPSPLGLVNYLLPFHMLAGGPIQSYDEFVRQPDVPPPLSLDAWVSGLERIASGVFKKFVLATVLSEIFLTGFRARGVYLLFEVQVFYVWLFLDFSGYSDVAVGVGKLMGVATPENFQRPYLARNLVDFWDRWHISLSLFIRRNIFVPLQLTLTRRFPNANSLLIAAGSFGVAFLLCGLWHGVGVRFVLWGLLHAVGLTMVNVYRTALTRRLGSKGVKQYLSRRLIHIVAVVLTFEFVAFSLLVVQYPFESIR